MTQKQTTHPFISLIQKAKKQNAEFTNLLQQAEDAFKQGNPALAFELALRAYEKTERTTLICRAIPTYMGKPRAQEVIEETMLSAVPVEIGFTEQGWFSMRIPVLLPKKQKGPVDYIRGLLYPALARFFRDKPPVRFRSCVIIYRHIYNRDFPERELRDHDNIEINLTTDAIALYTMTDDNPRVCNHYYCTAAGSEERTEVYIVPRSDFKLWQDLEPSFPENGVKLFEKQM